MWYEFHRILTFNSLGYVKPSTGDWLQQNDDSFGELLNRSPRLTWPCLLGCVVDTFEIPIDRKDALSAAEWKRVKVKALEIIAHKYVHEPMQTRLKVINSLIPISCVIHKLLHWNKRTMCNAHRRKHNGTSFLCAHPLAN
jgi:hypothetical protein